MNVKYLDLEILLDKAAYSVSALSPPTWHSPYILITCTTVPPSARVSFRAS